jgi:hypothetical protein
MRLEQAMVFESKPLVVAQFADRPRYQRALDWVAYGVMRSVLFLTGKRY